MSVLDEMMLDIAVPAHLETMGDTVLFHPLNGDAADIQAVTSKRQGLIRDDAEHQSVQTLLFVTTSECECGVEEFSLGDTVTVDDEAWSFHQMVETAGGFITGKFIKVDIQQYGKRPSNL